MCPYALISQAWSCTDASYNFCSKALKFRSKSLTVIGKWSSYSLVVDEHTYMHEVRNDNNLAYAYYTVNKQAWHLYPLNSRKKQSLYGQVNKILHGFVDLK